MSELELPEVETETQPETQLDRDDHLRPEFVRAVLDAVEDGDDEAARALVEPLHPADIADLLELIDEDDRLDSAHAVTCSHSSRFARNVRAASCAPSSEWFAPQPHCVSLAAGTSPAVVMSCSVSWTRV